MELYKNWLSVSANKVWVGVYIEGQNPVVEVAHRSGSPRPKWLEILDVLSLGRHLRYSSGLERSLRRIEKLLKEINKSAGTSFKLENLCLPAGEKLIFLTGG